jgi:signal transduction histidine kinase/DNA-binding response OmpR family regulator
VSRGQSPSASLRALIRATALVADGLAEERLVPLLVRCAAEAVGADSAAVFIQPERKGNKPDWQLAGAHGADPTVLAALPTNYGEGGGILAPVFQSARDVYERDLLDGAPPVAEVESRLPFRSLIGVPVRRRDSRAIGVLIVGAQRANAFEEEPAQQIVRSIGQLIGTGVDNARLAIGQLRERRMAAESAVTLGTVLESVGTGVSVVELDGTVRVANKALLGMFQVTGRTAGMSEADVFATAGVKPLEWNAFVARLRELNRNPAEIDESEWELATDPPRIIQRYSAPMRSLVGEVVGRVEVYTDITESRRLYTQLLNSEKLRAIGEMASGVAHDFNNLLASIVGQTELLHPDDLPPTTQLAITTIRQAALDGARMVRNLQGLARPRAETPSTAAELNETVLAAVEMARPRWAGVPLHGHGPIDVRLNLADPATLARVAIDPAELREVLLNLLFNAADAMPEGGQIEISTRIGRQRNTAEVEVRDTGQGIPEAVMARIFEPFFSTKGPKGSGLGLAVAYSIITRRGGEFQVESRVGEGTTFTIHLPNAPIPASGAVSAAASEAPNRASSVATGSALKGSRILVVDDEPGLVAIVKQLLERSGAVATVAHGGQAALEALHSPETKFDVVITDLDMPEVDGWAVAAAVKEQKPGTHVVMLTGWAGEIAPEDFKTRGVDVVLAKPCGRVELEAAIGALLAPKSVHGLDVLLVDDEAAFARAIRELLTLQGHQVTVVDSAAKALDAVATHSFDVVLTDYSLGTVTGAELAERLADRGSAPYVVLVTGYATEIDDPTLMSRGVDAVLPKPCRGDDLRQVLARVHPAA